MRKLANKSGFTLIEIVVVLIIIGILAAIALPNLFKNIRKSRGAQAISAMDAMKTPLEACATLHNTTTVGTAPCTLSGLNLTTFMNGWTYSVYTGGSTLPASSTTGAVYQPAGTYKTSDLVYTLYATDGVNGITLTRSSIGGAWNCSVGTASPYVGLC